MSVEPLDEKALRVPGFVGGEPIPLGDGQCWIFPKAMLEFLPVFGDDGVISAGVATSLGPEFDGMVRAYDEACRAVRDEEEAGETAADGSGGGELAAKPADPKPRRQPMDHLMGLAVFMLRRQYDLDNAALARLLRYRPDDEESTDRWNAIMDVVRGVAPKPKADGSASTP